MILETMDWWLTFLLRVLALQLLAAMCLSVPLLSIDVVSFLSYRLRRI